MILKYKEFLLEKKATYEFGCVMAGVDFEDWKSITDIVDNDDLYMPDDERYGKETYPHVTILYGLHDSVSFSDVKERLDMDSISISVDSISIFENKDYDVVKFSVKSKDLNKLNKSLSELPNSNEYPDYIPHITIAYVKSGEGKKYVKKLDDKIEISGIKDILYSMPDGNKKKFKLGTKK